MARCKKECGLCKQFYPFTRFEGICKVSNRKRKISKKCVKTRFFEAHPDGRKRNLREESDGNAVRLKSEIHEGVSGEGGSEGEAPEEGTGPVQNGDGDPTGSDSPKAEKKSEESAKGTGSEPVLGKKSAKKTDKKSSKKTTKKK